MAIVSISQIKHRRGNLEDLPQLASGELGWAIDARRLYIGNGTTNEGAPEIGNTELLTEYSDILALLHTYTYKGVDAGYTVSTGVDINNPTVRSIQQKLDDFVNVKDFGAKGDGTSDDTVAINRALYQLYCRSGNLISATQVRKVLYFPAGTYIVSAAVLIPPYANLQGAGLDRTVIKQVTSAIVVAKVADSLQQVDLAQGNNGATKSQYINVDGITFKQTDAVTGSPVTYTNIEDVFLISTGLQISFRNCKFEGPFVDHSTTSYINIINPQSTSSKACFRLNSPTAANGTTYNVVFKNCEFSSHTYAAAVDNTVYNVSFDQCYFSYLYGGIKVGSTPRGVKVTSSLFDKIYGQAVYSAAPGVVSAFNTYLDVGVNFLGINSNTAVTPVIEYSADDCSSFSDYFARIDAATSTYPRIQYNGYNDYSVIPGKQVQYGNYYVTGGKSQTLLDNQSSATATNITFDTTVITGAFIDYIITRGTNSARTGTLLLSVFNGNAAVNDTSRTNGVDPGITFTTAVSGGVCTIKYTSTNTGNTATFKYVVRYLI
jgi:hypothetical protein